MQTNYDIVICGASLGGVVAAYSACKSGKEVVLLEETSWIGGQLTSQAVPPDEHPWIEEQGCTETYRWYRDKIKNHYLNNPNFKIVWKKGGYWCPNASEVSRISAPPKLALSILEEMLAPYVGKNLTIYTNAKLLSCETNNNEIENVTYLINNKEVTFAAKFFVDATDTGELLPLSHTEYVIGAESKKETGEKRAKDKADPFDRQPSIYTLAFKNHGTGSYIIDKPKEYDYFKSLKMPYDNYPIFSMYGEDSSTGKAKLFGMFEGETDINGKELFPLFSYRRIYCKDCYIGPVDLNDITLLNWPQNDYYLGNLFEDDNLEYHHYMAKQLTLSFFYYLQTEAPRADGGIGYPEFELLYDELGTTDGLSMAPYIRESRRIKALYTIKEEDIEKGSHPDFPDTVGVGSYSMDLHITTKSNEFFYIPTERFTIPLGSMIPKKTINLIPGCKNIGTTHLTSSAYRLHPIEWNIGEVAGYLASYCLDNNIKPIDVYLNKDILNKFQLHLQNNGIQLHWK